MKKLLFIIVLLLCSCVRITREDYPVVYTKLNTDYVIQNTADSTYFYKIVDMWGEVPVIDSTYIFKRKRTKYNTTDNDLY